MNNLSINPVNMTIVPSIPQQSQKALFEASKLQWMASHGYSIALLLTEFHNYLLDADPTFNRPINELIEEWEKDAGFGGSVWPCWREWLDEQHTLFFALMEERGWKITKETKTDNGDYFYTMDWETPQGLICHIDVRAGYEAEDLNTIAQIYDADKWAKEYIFKYGDNEDNKLPPLTDILDAANNIKFELDMASRQLKLERVA